MILYCIVCYIVVFGMLLDEHTRLEEWSQADIFFFLFSPLTAPIVLGMSINNKNKN